VPRVRARISGTVAERTGADQGGARGNAKAPKARTPGDGRGRRRAKPTVRERARGGRGRARREGGRARSERGEPERRRKRQDRRSTRVKRRRGPTRRRRGRTEARGREEGGNTLTSGQAGARRGRRARAGVGSGEDRPGAVRQGRRPRREQPPSQAGRPPRGGAHTTSTGAQPERTNDTEPRRGRTRDGQSEGQRGKGPRAEKDMARGRAEGAEPKGQRGKKKRGGQEPEEGERHGPGEDGQAASTE